MRNGGVITVGWVFLAAEGGGGSDGDDDEIEDEEDVGWREPESEGDP